MLVRLLLPRDDHIDSELPKVLLGTFLWKRTIWGTFNIARTFLGTFIKHSILHSCGTLFWETYKSTILRTFWGERYSFGPLFWYFLKS